MPNNSIIKIDIQGFEQVYKRISLLYSREANSKMAKYLAAAGRECATRVLWPVVGLRKYPPLTEANQPPTPYYIRECGMQRGGTRKPEYNDMKSERLGTQWYVKAIKRGATEIGNRASYARYVVGDEQAQAMGIIGWKKLGETVMGKMAEITVVYSKWIAKLIKDLRL